MNRRPVAHRESWLDNDRVNAVLLAILVLIFLFGVCAVPPAWLEAAR